ncbi:unnamed protein product [Ilex paraguariensis]|uniref:Uncharacterized protein n=1 Tax=Ilex paraguariensis TaxID=185542 RepID=A0ABC8RH89_9AQUA
MSFEITPRWESGFVGVVKIGDTERAIAGVVRRGNKVGVPGADSDTINDHTHGVGYKGVMSDGVVGMKSNTIVSLSFGTQVLVNASSMGDALGSRRCWVTEDAEEGGAEEGDAEGGGVQEGGTQKGGIQEGGIQE